MAGRNIKKGEHICNNYGPISNRYFVIRYGIAIVDNEYDGIPIHVDLKGQDYKVVILFKDSNLEPFLGLVKKHL